MQKSLSSLMFVFSVAALVVAAPVGVRLAEGKVVGPPQVAWKDMTIAQKKAYMKTVVVPTMKPVFKAFDDKKFATVNCVTCHGTDGPERVYKMPSNDIRPLPNSKAGFEAKLKAEPTWPKWTEFMSQKVEPAMGKLLGMPVFDPKKPVEGALSCANCHKLEATK